MGSDKPRSNIVYSGRRSLFLILATITVLHTYTYYQSVFLSCITNHMKMMFLSIRNGSNPYVTAWGSATHLNSPQGFHSSKKVDKHWYIPCRWYDVVSRAVHFTVFVGVPKHIK